MGRNIVLLSDGTGNSAAKVWRTNVWRTFEGAGPFRKRSSRFLRRRRRYFDIQAVGDPWRCVRLRPETECRRHLQICVPQLQGRKRRALRLRLQPRRIYDPRRHRPDSQSRPCVCLRTKSELDPKPPRGLSASTAAERYHTMLPLASGGTGIRRPFANYPLSQSSTTSATIDVVKATSASWVCGIRWPPMACRWTR